MLKIEITHPDFPVLLITDRNGLVWAGDPLNLDDVADAVADVRAAEENDDWTPSESDGWTETEPAPAYSIDEFADVMERRDYHDVAHAIRDTMTTHQDKPAQEDDIRAYLGPVEATDDQVSALRKISDRIDERYPVPEDGDVTDVTEERGSAMTAAVEIVIDEDDPADKVAAWRSALALANRAHAEMTGALIATGWTESQIVRELGLSRPTARKAIGDHY